MDIERDLYKAAADLINKRYPTGWGGAAAILTESGKILTSVAPEVRLDALNLCMEVGACLEAHKINEHVTHSICLCRENETDLFLILSPCGVCQERLAYWGGSVKVAISNPENQVKFVELRKLMPYHWSEVNGGEL